jgi:hypothetical protein
MALSDLLGIKDLVGQIVAEVGRHIKDPNQLAQLEADIEKVFMTAQAAQNQAQAEINEIEAASPRLFISGWRPFIGWTCAAAILYSFLVYPILKAFWPAAVVVDLEGLWPLILGILGISGLRTYEKKSGVQGRH